MSNPDIIVLLGEPYVIGHGHGARVLHRVECYWCNGSGADRYGEACDVCDGPGYFEDNDCSCLRCRALEERVLLEQAYEDIKDELEAARVAE